MDLKDVGDDLSSAVLAFCENNIDYSGQLSVHGNITIVTDSNTAIAFFSKNLIREPTGTWSRCQTTVKNSFRHS